MKGQYRILGELFIFTIGILITSYVIISFQGIQESISDIAMKDNLARVSNLITTGISKASVQNSSLRLEIPVKISNYIYKISVSDNYLIISDLERPEINVTQKIINIAKGHNILIVGDRLLSSTKYIEITLREPNIIIQGF